MVFGRKDLTHTHMQSLRQIRLKGSCGEAASCILLLRPKNGVTQRVLALSGNRSNCSVFCARCSALGVLCSLLEVFFPRVLLYPLCPALRFTCARTLHKHKQNANRSPVPHPFFLPCNIQWEILLSCQT